MKQKIISNQQYEQERALYHITNVTVSNCVFAGESDGESPLKEGRNIEVIDCSFSLRYPLWHVETFFVDKCQMDELTRAPLWYAKDGVILNSSISGVKAIRECDNINIENCHIVSTEFGWKSHHIKMINCDIVGEYLFFDSGHIFLKNIKMKGKYSFQYIEDLTIEDSYLDTKDAFWHSKNVVVKNCTVKGEYLGWFSEGLTLINCKIIGTQPLCYCDNLKLISCQMEGCDFSFEYSQVEAEISGHVDSIKNPKSGTIVLDSVGETIFEDAVIECRGEIIVRNHK